ncbi:MAG: ATP-binding protein [Zoogloeaceae bacterium]|nr:ATP-binding protein [Zoogloeaceae bacterium]
MKFEFEKLGLLDKAEIEIADLTVICGENNTGKTYSTYAIYGFLRVWRKILQGIIAAEFGKEILSQDGHQFDLEKHFSGKINDYLTRVASEYKDLLSRVFATRKNAFSETGVFVSVREKQDFLGKPYQRRVQANPAGKVLAIIKKEANSSVLEVLAADEDLLRDSFGGLSYFIADAIAEIVFKPHLPRAHIASAERTGASIFRKELDIARTRMLKALSELDSRELKNPFALFDKIESDYAWPVEDNVEFVRQLEEIDKQESELTKAVPEILASFNNVIGGSYRVIRDFGLVFQARGGGKQRFTMNEASSCVRALLDIGFYLRCKAKPGDLFIIDEPELNLHPKNQRMFARLLARLVNAGVKVFITTHSDYLVKEFNTLIMLNQKTEHTEKVRAHYEYEEAELLNPDSIRLYMTKEKKKGRGRFVLAPAKIHHDCGIEVETFDDTIENINKIQNDILYGGSI